MDQDLRIRAVSDSDWDSIVALEADAYTAQELSEGRAALESGSAPHRAPASSWTSNGGPWATCWRCPTRCTSTRT